MMKTRKQANSQVAQRAIAAVLLLPFLLMMCVTVPGADMTVTFTAPGDDGDVGQASEYLVYYSQIAFADTTVDSLLALGLVDTAHFCTPPDTAGAVEQCVLEGLSGDTRYWVAIKAADEVPNWSELSNVISAVTPDDAAPGCIQDLRVLGD